MSCFVLLWNCLAVAKVPIKRFVLRNGAKVIVVERHSQPLVACQVWVKVGSADEGEQEAGVAHLIEHMVFKPTRSHPQGVASVIEALGGTVNAFTSYDYTAYHFVVRSEGFREALFALLDSVLNPLFDPRELEREKGVVLEEIKMNRDDPERRFYRELWQQVFSGHPYGRPVIGYEGTVRALRRGDLMAFHRKWYTPENIVVVIVGDVRTDEVLRWVEEALGGIEGKGSERPRTLKPPFRLPRVFFERGSRREVILLGFRIPEVTSPDTCAFDVLSEVLGGGRTSRLVRRLKEEKGVAVSIDVYVSTFRDAGLFAIEAIPAPSRESELIEGISEELKGILSEGVSDRELERAKRSIVTSFLYQRETYRGEAQLLGFFEVMLGDARKVDEYIESIKSVSGDDLKGALSLMLSSSPVAGLMSPKGEGEDVFEGIVKEAFGPIRKTRLANGSELLLLEDHSLPIVAVTVAFRGGLSSEDRERAGLSQLLSRCLTRGTAKMTSLEIASKIEDMGAVLEGFSGRDVFGLRGKVPSQYLGDFLDLIGEILKNPSFPEEELRKAKAEQLEALKRQREQLTALTFQRFRSELFGDHPYGLNPLGTEETIAAITRQDLLDYWHHNAIPSRMVISVVGDVSWPELVRIVEVKIGDLEGKGKREVFTVAVPHRSFFKELQYGRGEQAHILVGTTGPAVNSPQAYPLEVLGSLFRGQGGRLFRRLREEMGIAYQVFFFVSLNLQGGYLGAYVATSPEKVKMALGGIKEVFDEVLREGVTQEELERAKRYLLGVHELSLQGYLALSDRMALDELYGLGAEHFLLYPQRIQEVTKDDLAEVIKRYLDPERMSVLILRPSV